MKRILFIFLLLCVCSFAACGAKESEEEFRIPVTSSELRYETGVEVYTVDNEGVLYTLTNYSIDDDDIMSRFSPRLDMYDTEGELLGSLELPENFRNTKIMLMTIDEDRLYIIFSGGSNRFILYAYDIEQQTGEELYTFTNYSMINKICFIDGKIYFIAEDKSQINKKSYAGNDNAEDFAYEGEVFGYIDIETKKQYGIGIEFPLSMSKTLNDTVLVYAYNDEDGYYFTEFFPEDNTLETVGCKNFTKDLVFEVCDKENRFIYTKADRQNPGRIVMVGSVTENEGSAEIASNAYYDFYNSTNWFTYKGGQVFYKDKDNMINRLTLRDKYIGSTSIKMLMPRYTEVYSPFSCGYTIEKETVDAEKLVLKVLARDTDYNVCLFNSRDDAAASIKKNGAYYPLNKVDGVSEYLDSCFPYIKEAATTENGDIWMLPIDISLQGLIYDKKLCEEAGIDLEKVTDFSEFILLTKKLKDENYDNAVITFSTLLEQFFAQYFTVYTTVETDLFRDMAALLKSATEEEEWWGDISLNNILAYGEENKSLYYDEYTGLRYMRIGDRIGEDTSYGACSYPTISPDVLPQANCIFLMVNPEAENLEDSLEFISAYAKYLLGQKDSCILKDISTYSDTEFIRDVYKVFENAQITFTMDYALYMDGFERYVAGEITLDEFVADAERKLRMYLNE